MQTRSNSKGSLQPRLPTFNQGVQVLTVDREATGALQTIALDHAITQEGDVIWVDAFEQAQTTLMADLAPDERILDRIQVARGFTPYQHYELLNEARQRTADIDASLLIVPSVDHRYRKDDLPKGRPQEMIEAVASKLSEIESETGTPILVTCIKEDSWTAPVKNLASSQLECEITKFGPRFVGADYETLVYPVENGMYQTTLSYWSEILESRLSAPTPTSSGQASRSEMTARGSMSD